MNILIFGSRGYLGQYFQAKYPDAACPSVDIADAHAVSEALDEHKPDVVINTAGKTGRPNVDWCEDHKIETVHSNVVGPLVLVEECEKRGIYLVHLGTGCIYSCYETKPLTEEYFPNFTVSFYSRTKGAIDQLLQDFPILNIRLRMPFDGTDSERNLINKLRKYDRVLDAPNSVTYIPELLEVVGQLIEKKAIGTYNVVNPGVVTPYRIMELYKEVVDPNHAFEKLEESSLPDVVKAGRSSCILSTQKLEEQGITMSSAEDALREAMGEMSGV